jgi:exosortase A
MLMNDTAPLVQSSKGARLAPSTIALIVLAMLAPLALFFPTAASIVAIWNSSETFAHGYVIVPISLWLIWRKRENFLLYPPRPYWPALGLLALCGAGWLAARLGGVQFIMQYAFAAMFPLVALAVLGRRLALSLAFPLLFLLFAVPFGDIFIAPLIEFTADFTVGALQLTGIPVLRNGTRFEIPTGSWSVVTACSGVRYLISSVTIGCLYAYLSYRSVPRRLAFIGLSIVVPVIANGLRAYMIVMIGHTSNMELATGVDHLIYGWVWFGIVMFVMFWVGSYWRDDHLETPAGAQAGTAAQAPVNLAGVAALAVAVCALWPAFALFNDKANHNPAPVALAAPAISWSAAPAFAQWKPNFMTPDAQVAAQYAQPGSGRPVALNVLYYRNQSASHALISSVNTMAGEKDAYHQVGQDTRSEQLAGQGLVLREARMSGPEGSFLVWYWYWIEGRHTASDMGGKLLQAKAKLLFHGDDGAAVMLAAPYGERADDAREALRAFLRTEGDAIERALAAARGK